MCVQRWDGQRPEKLSVTEMINRKREEDLRRIREFCLFDDIFFTKCFEGDTECMELILRIVLDKPDLKVADVRTQVFVENLLNRSVRLDILATDSAGRKYNTEIQRLDKGAGRKRARYNSSMMDAVHLQKGEDFDSLPETFVIFITENDVMGRGEAVYRVERCFLENGERFGDGAHILYVNGACRDETPVGRLMHDFSCTDPSDMYYEVLANRVRFFKESKEGIAVMSRFAEEIRRESKEEGIHETMNAVVHRMLRAGKYALEEIVAISGLPLDEVKQMDANRTA